MLGDDRDLGNICDFFHLSLKGSHTSVYHGVGPAWNQGRHTYIISQGCCPMENGHWTLLLIAVKFFMNLEENESSMSLPAGREL